MNDSPRVPRPYGKVTNAPPPPADRPSRILHAGCGGLFGLVVGTAFVWIRSITPRWAAVGAVVVLTIVASWAAGRWGDRFWNWAIHQRPWGGPRRP